MKRIFLVAIAVMAFGFTNAQQTRFGIKGGLNITTYSGGDYWDANSLVGFQIGGFAEIKVIERLAIQPEVLFSTQGASLDSPVGDFDDKLNYINVPDLVRLLRYCIFRTESFKKSLHCCIVCFDRKLIDVK